MLTIYPKIVNGFGNTKGKVYQIKLCFLGYQEIYTKLTNQSDQNSLNYQNSKARR